MLKMSAEFKCQISVFLEPFREPKTSVCERYSEQYSLMAHISNKQPGVFSVFQATSY